MTSMRLPSALESWHPWLRWFEPELAAALGDVLRRMHPLLGRYQGLRQKGVAELDGVEDLRRRGSYERLLSSEWLLATELPDEFLRRAAAGEHLFLSPRPRAQQADRLIVALFDSGPMQLGAPRLAQLALWILLARRALDAGGELRWGRVQQPGQWHGAASSEDLKRMLSGRTFESAHPEHWEAWSAWIAENATGVGERWLVSHDVDAARRMPLPPSHAVQLRPALDGETLEAKLLAGAAARSIFLPLPSTQRTPQLLKGRFESQAAADAHRGHCERFSLKMAPIISRSGTQVAVPLLDGHGVLIFQTQSVKRGRAPPAPKRADWSRRGEPLCGAFAGKTLGMVLAYQGYVAPNVPPVSQLMFWRMQDFTGIQSRPAPEQFDAPPGRGSLLPCIWQREPGKSRLFVRDASRRLIGWVATRGGTIHPVRGPLLLDEQVLAMAPAGDDRVVYLRIDRNAPVVRFVGHAGREPREHRMAVSLDGPTTAFIAGVDVWRHGFGACAVLTGTRVAREHWRILDGTSATAPDPGDFFDVELPQGGHGVGLVKSEPGEPCALVVKSQNGCDLSLQTSAGNELIYSTSSPIERVSACPASGVLAMLTRERELHVYDTIRRSVRLVAHSHTHVVKAVA